jgi:hypothetical protein
MKFLMKMIPLWMAVSVASSAGTPPMALSESAIADLYAPKNLPSGKIAYQAGAAVDLMQNQLVAVFSGLKSVLRQHNLDLNSWFREDHFVYLADYLTDQEKKRLISVLREMRGRIQSGATDMRAILGGLSPAFLVAKVGKLDSEVLRLKDQHEDVIRFAQTKHAIENQQTYGDLPYSYHLRKVRGVLKRFGFGPKDSFFGLKLGTAAWLHDCIEDTDVTYEQIGELFGYDIAEIVRGVTKLEKTDTLNGVELITRTHERTRLNRGSRILKLADHIANLEEGLTDLFAGRPTKVLKYFNEWALFKQILYVPGDADKMWQHLERLLTDLPYARSLIKEQTLRACEEPIDYTE